MELFGEKSGRAKNYRIPAIIVTKHGTIIACADERFFTGGDNPNRIDKVIRRSEDGGLTFGELIIAREEQGSSKNNSSAAIDPCLLYDEASDVIYMLYSHTPAGIGILNSKRGFGVVGYSSLITRGKESFYEKNGILYTAPGDLPTDFSIDEQGNVRDSVNKYVSNIYTYDGDFREYSTSYLCLIKSFDDGKSWTDPIQLNNQIKKTYMSFIGAGPGVGIVKRLGDKKGRFIFPIYYNTAKTGLGLSSAVIFSDDGGESWVLGKSQNDCRRRIGKGSRFVLPFDCLTESQVIELPNGNIKAFIRNHSTRRLIATAESSDAGETWHNFAHHQLLTSSICQCSVINFKYEGREYTAFLNAAHKRERKNGVLRISADYGESFPYTYNITEGGFVYSSICQIDEETLGIAYEPSIEHETIEFIRLKIKSLLSI